jgi:hypothetical protein
VAVCTRSRVGLSLSHTQSNCACDHEGIASTPAGVYLRERIRGPSHNLDDPGCRTKRRQKKKRSYNYDSLPPFRAKGRSRRTMVDERLARDGQAGRETVDMSSTQWGSNPQTEQEPADTVLLHLLKYCSTMGCQSARLNKVRRLAELESLRQCHVLATIITIGRFSQGSSMRVQTKHTRSAERRRCFFYIFTFNMKKTESGLDFSLRTRRTYRWR